MLCLKQFIKNQKLENQNLQDKSCCLEMENKNFANKNDDFLEQTKQLDIYKYNF